MKKQADEYKWNSHGQTSSEMKTSQQTVTQSLPNKVCEGPQDVYLAKQEECREFIV